MERPSLVLLGSALLTGCSAAPDPMPRATPAPSATYAGQQCGGARSWWAKQGAESGELMTYNKITVGHSDIRWNSVPIDRPTLAAYLAAVSQSDPAPVTVLIPAAAAECAAVESIRRLMDAELRCRSENYCVEYAEAAWTKAHPPVPALENAVAP